jgi:peptide-methionine (R)-S-oxide reductase
MKKTIAEWKKNLPKSVFHILWEHGTEPPFSGIYVNEKGNGIYYCAGCGQQLFHSSSKFDSGSGWPSFTNPINNELIMNKIDFSMGMERVEVLCSSCGGHLGHVFNDGPRPNGKRYCINSLALTFIKQ